MNFLLFGIYFYRSHISFTAVKTMPPCNNSHTDDGSVKKKKSPGSASLFYKSNTQGFFFFQMPAAVYTGNIMTLSQMVTRSCYDSVNNLHSAN